jgi:peptidoglycan/LPS O-acetylase OafA/YrhL
MAGLILFIIDSSIILFIILSPILLPLIARISSKGQTASGIISIMIGSFLYIVYFVPNSLDWQTHYLLAFSLEYLSYLLISEYSFRNIDMMIEYLSAIYIIVGIIMLLKSKRRGSLKEQ